jgi:hypothetical protein
MWTGEAGPFGSILTALFPANSKKSAYHYRILESANARGNPKSRSIAVMRYRMQLGKLHVVQTLDAMLIKQVVAC